MTAANCFKKATGELSFPATVTIKRGGLQVGVVGLAATIVDKTISPYFSTAIRLTVGHEELPGHDQFPPISHHRRVASRGGQVRRAGQELVAIVRTAQP